MGKRVTAQAWNGNIWGGFDGTATLEPFSNFEPFPPADVDSPPIFEETKLLLLKDLIILNVGSFLSR